MTIPNAAFCVAGSIFRAFPRLRPFGVPPSGGIGVPTFHAVPKATA